MFSVENDSDRPGNFSGCLSELVPDHHPDEDEDEGRDNHCRESVPHHPQVLETVECFSNKSFDYMNGMG